MVGSLSRYWWLVILRGVFAILFGALAFVWPGITWLTLIIMFGVYAIVDGVITAATGLARTKDTPRWWTFLLEGLIGIAAGVIALIRPDLATLVLLYVIAAWAIFTGILEIVTAIRLRDEITNEWVMGLGGVLSVALGLLLFFQPVTGSLVIIWTIAAYAIIFGILLVALGFRLRSWKAPDSREPVPSIR